MLYSEKLRPFAAAHPCRTIDVDGAQFRYILTGKPEGRTLVFLNGGMNTLEMWMDYAGALSGDCRVLLFDYPRELRTNQALVTGMHAFFRKLGIEAPILIGKRNRDEVFETARELLRKMGLSDKESAYPCQLSGGQQQRVSIARALAMKPEILFFDEPTSALDPELTGEILHVIRDLAAEKMTMVIVTHEMQFARDVSDHLVFMDGGVIVEQGEPHEIINHPAQERTIQFLRRFSDRG